MKTSHQVVVPLFIAGAGTFVLLSVLCPWLGAWGIAVGTMAGAAIGYLGYRVRDVVRAVPRAVRAVSPSTARAFTRMGRQVSEWAAWLVDLVVRPRIGTLSVLFGTVPVLWCVLLVAVYVGDAFIVHPPPDRPLGMLTIPMGLFMTLFTPALVTMLVSLLIIGWSWILEMCLVGAVCAYPGTLLLMWREFRGPAINKMRYGYKGVRVRTLLLLYLQKDARFTWRQYLWLHCLGMFAVYVLTATLFIRTLWLVASVSRFALVLLRLIHCRERTVCGVYGPTGALIVWALMTRLAPEMGPLPHLAATLAAGGLSVLLGRYIGVPIIARRVLRLEPARG